MTRRRPHKDGKELREKREGYTKIINNRGRYIALNVLSDITQLVPINFSTFLTVQHYGTNASLRSVIPNTQTTLDILYKKYA
jgi:hypothetical protein